MCVCACVREIERERIKDDLYAAAFFEPGPGGFLTPWHPLAGGSTEEAWSRYVSQQVGEERW